VLGICVLEVLLAVEGNILNEYTLEILSLVVVLLVGLLKLYLKVSVAFVMPVEEAL
jgi:hypothetical protein